jgi:hypothetical protein
MSRSFFINGRNSANLELLIDKTSSIYLNVKLKALASWIFLFFTGFWRNSDSYEYKNKSARRGAQFVHIGMPTSCWNSIPQRCHIRNYGSKFVVLDYNSTYFSNKIQKGKIYYSEEQVISILEFLIDNIFVSFGGYCFSRTFMILKLKSSRLS